MAHIIAVANCKHKRFICSYCGFEIPLICKECGFKNGLFAVLTIYVCSLLQIVELLDTIPGVGRTTAEIIVSEIGVDMSRFPSASHLAAWAGLAPGNYESAGKRLSGKTRKGNQTLRSGLMQSAHVASRSRTYLAAQYRRIAARRGKKRATMAVAHSILVIAYHVIGGHEPYRELGVNYFDQQRPETMTKRLVKRLEQLGHRVTLESQNLDRFHPRFTNRGSQSLP